MEIFELQQLGAVFSVLSVLRCYKQNLVVRDSPTRVEARLNTSTLTLRVVGGDEKGSLKFETVKCGRRVPSDSDKRKTALAKASSMYTR
jgi:hypothetical protein